MKPKVINRKPGIELLSPAGSWESLMGAIQAGADSIYFGVEQLNMRARSSINFSMDDLKKIAELSRKHNIKTYLTLNTIIYDHDISLMKRIVNEAKLNKIDAIIAHDQSVLNYCKKIGIPVHISTQANVSNIEAIEFYSNYADVIVLARELTLKQVADIIHGIIRKKIKGASDELVKIEIFGHGALCMAVSGKCYLSLHSHNASANRGVCIQNCRRNYIVTDKEDGVEFEIDNDYIMSAKDLCTIDFIDKILDAGVSVLKIEGRGRNEEYVFTTTKCYREAIDSYVNGTYTPEKVNQWKQMMETVFNRGFWDGYYLGKKIGEWNNSSGSKASKQKIYVGKGIKYFDKIKVGEFKLETQSLSVGDEIIVSGPTTGVVQSKVNELRVNDAVVEKVKKGEVFSLPISAKIRLSDKLYKIVDAEI